MFSATVIFVFSGALLFAFVENTEKKDAKFQLLRIERKNGNHENATIDDVSDAMLNGFAVSEVIAGWSYRTNGNSTSTVSPSDTDVRVANVEAPTKNLYYRILHEKWSSRLPNAFCRRHYSTSRPFGKNRRFKCLRIFWRADVDGYLRRPTARQDLTFFGYDRDTKIVSAITNRALTFVTARRLLLDCISSAFRAWTHASDGRLIFTRIPFSLGTDKRSFLDSVVTISFRPKNHADKNHEFTKGVLAHAHSEYVHVREDLRFCISPASIMCDWVALWSSKRPMFAARRMSTRKLKSRYGSHFETALDYFRSTFDDTDLFLVLVHEIGHVLGFGHTDNADSDGSAPPRSVMHPTYSSNSNITLTDRLAIVRFFQNLFELRHVSKRSVYEENSDSGIEDDDTSEKEDSDESDIDNDYHTDVDYEVVEDLFAPEENHTTEIQESSTVSEENATRDEPKYPPSYFEHTNTANVKAVSGLVRGFVKYALDWYNTNFAQNNETLV